MLTLKKPISILLSVLMIFGIFAVVPFSAMAVETVAAIGETAYASLKEAFEAAQNGDTITVTEAHEFADSAVLKAGVDITLDLNGNNITYTGADYAFMLDQAKGGKFSRLTVNNAADVTATQGGVFQILKNNNGRVNLSAYRFSGEEYTNIGIVKGKIQINFFEIIHKPCIREFHIDSRNNGRKMDIQYLLFGDCSITISLVHEEAVYTVFHSSESDNVSIDLDYPDGRYEVRVELSEADEFGFGVEPQIIETIPYILGDPVIQAMCQNSEYQITQCNIDGVLKRIKNFYMAHCKMKLKQ